VYYSATLWHPPYSIYQQFLFDTIDSMHKEGNSYIKIAQWMNEQAQPCMVYPYEEEEEQ
jgi:hypothetical protein